MTCEKRERARLPAPEKRSPIPGPRRGRALALLLTGGSLLLAATECRRNGTAGSVLADALNAVYAIEGRDVRLTGGRSEVRAAPGSEAMMVTSVFGPPVHGDIDGESGEDAALILVHSPGGSGTFYYVAAFLGSGRTAGGTNAVLLGDRVAPQNVSIDGRTIVVNYADRRPGEPMSAPPGIGKTLRLAVKDGRLAAR
jgi:hypothetical protein